MLDYIKLTAPVEPNTNIYDNDCPACGRAKLSISRLEDGSILYNCFRASCSLSGRIPPSGVFYPNVTQVTTPPARQQGNPYIGNLTGLPAEQYPRLNAEVGFREVHHNIARVMWANVEQRVAYPILSPTGRRRGWVLRSYEQGVRPKALTFMDTGAAKTSHYRRHGSAKTYLVEDIPSAVRGSLYANTVSLQGTSITDDAVMELQEFYDDIVICLDNDATVQAIKLQRDLDLFFRKVDIVVPDKDLKDMSEEELEEFMSD